MLVRLEVDTFVASVDQGYDGGDERGAGYDSGAANLVAVTVDV